MTGEELQDVVQIVKQRSLEWRNYTDRVGGRTVGWEVKVCSFLSSGEGEKSYWPSLKGGTCQGDTVVICSCT